MSLQELAALETQQAIESANYENAEVTYAVINEGDLLQVRIVICIYQESLFSRDQSEQARVESERKGSGMNYKELEVCRSQS